MSEVIACHNCGLPSDCSSSAGRKITIEIQPQSRFHRVSRRTVWCHSDLCAYQALAIARYGPASHKWPISLAQFRATNPLASQERSDRPEMGSEVADSKEANMGLVGDLDLPQQEPISGRKTAPGTRAAGRPRKWQSEAERKRVYRQRTADRDAAHGPPDSHQRPEAEEGV